ncbi:putative membrane protein [Candida maltosa Xu316]|uniref:Putative membrane protein n=1 Tax=Candida maltosa (strain Xu316) TaxID=1245528 RepID=M3HEU4_CANMX|nr:putative membrane protein [Candida maltosa Xu316]
MASTLQEVTRHHHHKHAPTPTITIFARDDTATEMPTLSTSEEPTATITHIPQSHNPFINVPTLPTNLIFIIVAAILGALLLVIMVVRTVNYFKYSKKAHNEKETYYANLTDVLNHPHHAQSRNSSVLDLSSSSTTSSGHGRSYRNTVLGNNTNTNNNKDNQKRTSMFISPTMDLKGFSLPLYSTQHNSSSASLLLRYANQNSDSSTMASTAYDDKSKFTLDGSSINGSTISGSTTNDGKYVPSKAPMRPPSVFLEALLNEDLDDVKEEGKTDK